jgi:hypothetical protein
MEGIMRTTRHQDERLTDLILDWVKEEIEIGDLYEGDVITRYIRENYNPEDVFKESELSDWAFENGYRRFE